MYRHRHYYIIEYILTANSVIHGLCKLPAYICLVTVFKIHYNSAFIKTVFHTGKSSVKAVLLLHTVIAYISRICILQSLAAYSAAPACYPVHTLKTGVTQAVGSAFINNTAAADTVYIIRIYYIKNSFNHNISVFISFASFAASPEYLAAILLLSIMALSLSSEPTSTTASLPLVTAV